MLDSPRGQQRITRDDIAPLLGEYAELTSFHDAMMFLQDITGQVHLVPVYDEDLPDLYAALKAEIAVERFEQGSSGVER